MSEVQHNRDAFIRDPEQWSPALAQRLAEQEGIYALQQDHWSVIVYLRQYYLENKTPPVMKRVCHELGLRESCVSELFNSPEIAWRVAGLPDPGEEAQWYKETSEILQRQNPL